VSEKRERPDEAIAKLTEAMEEWGEAWSSLWCAELMAYATSLERIIAEQEKSMSYRIGRSVMGDFQDTIVRAEKAEQRVAALEDVCSQHFQSLNDAKAEISRLKSEAEERERRAFEGGFIYASTGQKANGETVSLPLTSYILAQIKKGFAAYKKSQEPK
jgi:hypothetical protein